MSNQMEHIDATITLAPDVINHFQELI